MIGNPVVGARAVRAAGKRLLIRRGWRGDVRDLDPPIGVRVLAPRIRRRAGQPIRRFFP